MSKKFRDYLFLLFILIFLVSTGLISLYASGYEINWSWPPRFNRLLIKTGLIVVESTPRGATIYLNDRPQTTFSLNPWAGEYLTTNAKVRNVLPGDYSLRLELPGYWPLTKKISVYSSQTTYLKDINLFRADTPQLLAAGESSQLWLSPSRKYLYAPTQQKLITIKTGQARILPVSDAGNRGEWLTTEDRLLVSGHFLAPEASGDTDYEQLIGDSATDWYYETATKRLYYQNKSSLGYLDLATRTSALLLSGGDYLAYQPRNQKLYVVSREGDKVFLKKFALSTAAKEQEVSLPAVGHYRFVPTNSEFLNLYDDQNQTLYLFNPDDLSSGEKTISGLVDWQWLDGTTMIYNNRWEIYLADLHQNNNRLLTRVGEEIKKLAWSKNHAYLIFATNNSLNIYDQKISLITKIFQATEVASPVLDDKANILYFWADRDGQRGIYSLLLK